MKHLAWAILGVLTVLVFSGCGPGLTAKNDMASSVSPYVCAPADTNRSTYWCQMAGGVATAPAGTTGTVQ